MPFFGAGGNTKTHNVFALLYMCCSNLWYLCVSSRHNFQLSKLFRLALWPHALPDGLSLGHPDAHLLNQDVSFGVKTKTFRSESNGTNLVQRQPE